MTIPKAKLAGLALIAALCAGFTLGLTAPASADEHYSPLWNTACGQGVEITEGCAAVLARTIVDAASYPWSAIGLINFTGFGKRASCTGALIGERLVLTAAHCFYLPHLIGGGRVGEWILAPSVHFVAGYQRGGYVSHSKAINYVVPKAFPEEDWALVELRDPIGLSAGYLGWAVLNPAGLERALGSGARVALAGYPQIRRHVMSVDMECKGSHFRDGQALFAHRCADMKGDSGGPLLLLQDGKATIVAVNSRWLADLDEVISISFPVATFYTTILAMLGGDRSVKNMDGLAGLPGRPPDSRQLTALRGEGSKKSPPSKTAPATPATTSIKSEPNTYFDGPWHGTMMCGTCENCLGPLTREVQIDIQEGSFEITMDGTYHGEGTVDKKSNMEIHYTAGVNWRLRFRPTFEFAGKLVGKIFQLEGKRGSRKCNLSLSRQTS